MGPWLETIGITLVAAFGIYLGKTFSGFRKPYWIWGYCLSLVLIAVLAVSRFTDVFGILPPWFQLTAGRSRFVVLALAATIGLVTPLSRLSSKLERILLFMLMIAVVFWFSILPFLVPALIRDELSNLQTIVNAEGICFQTKDYTCGPAAAVTALGKLGLEGQEGEIAILSHTNPITGTLPWCLYTALEERYADSGLRCQYRYFDSVEQLRGAGITLAAVKNTLLSDHCVAILKVTDHTVTFADPVFGRVLVSHEEFKKMWRYSGIVLKRDTI